MLANAKMAWYYDFQNWNRDVNFLTGHHAIRWTRSGRWWNDSWDNLSSQDQVLKWHIGYRPYSKGKVKHIKALKKCPLGKSKVKRTLIVTLGSTTPALGILLTKPIAWFDCCTKTKCKMTPNRKISISTSLHCTSWLISAICREFAQLTWRTWIQQLTMFFTWWLCQKVSCYPVCDHIFAKLSRRMFSRLVRGEMALVRGCVLIGYGRTIPYNHLLGSKIIFGVAAPSQYI